VTEVSVVIVSYNTRDLLEGCIRSVQRNTSPGIDYEIIVVDNASSDHSAQMIEAMFPDITLIALDENVGFGRGCNIGARAANGRYICLVNPDAELVGDTLHALVLFARENPSAGLYGGRSVHNDGSLDPKSCWKLPSLWSLFCFGTGLSAAFRDSAIFDPEAMGRWQRDSVREVDAITGYLLMVHSAAWKRLDGFDEQFFLYGEDLDLGRRARQLGYRPIITPEAVVRHIGGAASTRSHKLVMLMTGKATYVGKRWHGPARQFGLACLLTGSWLRSRRRRSPWREMWDQRRTWIAGYPPHQQTTPVVDLTTSPETTGGYTVKPSSSRSSN
jgi:N-acetylglucosaminyl-diphospho-decaprenol L-rhamnosyltransferase